MAKRALKSRKNKTWELPKPMTPPEPICLNSIGRQRLLTVVDVKNIIVKTGLPLKVNEGKFHYWLNNSVEWTLREQLSERFSRTHLDNLKSSLETYKTLSWNLVQSELPPPRLPSEWLLEVAKWVTDAEKLLDQRKTGGAARNVELSIFYPRAIGLFHAGFKEMPDEVISSIATGKRGAVFRFLSSVSSTVNSRIKERSFAVSVPAELEARAYWHPIADDTFRQRLKVAIRLQIGAEQLATQTEYFPISGKMMSRISGNDGPAWRIFSAEFREVLKLRDSQK